MPSLDRTPTNTARAPFVEIGHFSGGQPYQRSRDQWAHLGELHCPLVAGPVARAFLDVDWEAPLACEALRDRNVDERVVFAPEKLSARRQFCRIIEPAAPKSLFIGRAVQLEDRLTHSLVFCACATRERLDRAAATFAIPTEDAILAQVREQADLRAMEFLERDEHLRRLAGALAQAALGRGRIIAISGEAGAGKTTLVERFSADQASAARIYAGACENLSTPEPLLPLRDIVRAGKVALDLSRGNVAAFEGMLRLLGEGGDRRC